MIAFFAFRGLEPGASQSLSTSPRWPPAFAACSPIRAPRSVSARCSSKASSSTACFPMWRCCCWRADRRTRPMPASSSPAFGLGGIMFSLSLPFLVVRVTERQLMLTGATVRGDRLHPDRAEHGLVHPGRGVRAVRPRLLHAAQQHPGARHRPVADRARRRAVDAFVGVLFRPGDRADLLRLCLRPFRHQRAAAHRRRGDHGHRAGLRAAVCGTGGRDTRALPKGAKSPIILSSSARGAARKRRG